LGFAGGNHTGLNKRPKPKLPKTMGKRGRGRVIVFNGGKKKNTPT